MNNDKGLTKEEVGNYVLKINEVFLSKALTIIDDNIFDKELAPIYEAVFPVIKKRYKYRSRVEKYYTQKHTVNTLMVFHKVREKVEALLDESIRIVEAENYFSSGFLHTQINVEYLLHYLVIAFKKSIAKQLSFDILDKQLALELSPQEDSEEY